MKPRNFPGRKTLRAAAIKLRQGEPLSAHERDMLMQPRDIRVRVGRAKRHLSGVPA